MPTPSVDAARKRFSSSGCRPGEGAEAGRARRLDGGAQALDDRAGGRQRDTRGVVAVGLAPQRMEHTTGSGRGRPAMSQGQSPGPGLRG